MFRKPKKTSKASFRRKKKGRAAGGGVDGSGDGGEGGGAAGARSERVFRKRVGGDGSSSSDEDGSGAAGGGADGGGGSSTSALLEQMRRDRERSRGKRRRAAGGSDDDDDGGGGGGGGGGEGGGDDAKGRGVMHEYRPADPSQRMSAGDMATRGAEYHPAAITRDGSSAAAAGKSAEEVGDGKGGGDGKGDGIYRGHTASRNKFLAGPLKAPTFVRTTCRFDYQPDICKDYKDTGFCGFGDTCIYLHDRGDTMTGWQLERQYEEQKRREAERKEREMEKFLKRANGGGAGGGGVDSDSEDGEDGEGKKAATAADDGLPFACHLCRGPFRDPVVTSCGHYFCQGCIMDRVRGSSSSSAGDGEGDATCPVCSKDTHGVFNAPTKLEAKKRRAVGRDGTWEEFMEASRKKIDKAGDDDE